VIVTPFADQTSVANLTVAIVGAGPSGFYAAEALLKMGATVALIERLPTPFGLVRYGVAPDHPKLKMASLAFEKVAKMPGFHFFGSVEVGRTVSVAELQACFHAVVFAHGASDDKKLDVPGESLAGSHTAAGFVAWYNGHPDHRDSIFDFSAESAVIIGNGNVALDIARILAKPVAMLANTDIARHALAQLAESRIRDIHVVGRRGPAQARFSPRELSEIGQIEGCDAVCASSDRGDDRAGTELSNDPAKRDMQLNLATFERFAEQGVLKASGASEARRKTCHFHFRKTPRSINGDTRVESMTFDTTRLESASLVRDTDTATGKDLLQSSAWTIPCGMVIRAVGYRGRPITGLAFDHTRGVVPTVEHRVIDAHGDVVAGLYATGWIKRGPTGIIGHNRADSVAVIKTLLDDVQTKPFVERGGIHALLGLLSQSGSRAVTFADWQRIDQAEIAAGTMLGKPRDKFTRIADMLGVVSMSGG